MWKYPGGLESLFPKPPEPSDALQVALLYAPKQDRFIMRLHKMPMPAPVPSHPFVSLRVGDLFAPGSERPSNEFVADHFKGYGPVLRIVEIVDGVGLTWLLNEEGAWYVSTSQRIDSW